MFQERVEAKRSIVKRFRGEVTVEGLLVKERL
jgi:hypothetical protein